MGWAILAITDGITRVDLLSKSDGFYLIDWQPNTPDPKDGGVYQNSPFADGRRPVYMKYENYAESLELGLVAGDEDAAICYLTTLRHLLDKAIAYWTDDWAEAPVWIEAQADCETNPRYAVISYGKLAPDPNPYASLFTGVDSDGKTVAEGLNLILEHPWWEAEVPGTYKTLYTRPPIRQPLVWWYGPHNGYTGRRALPDEALIQNLYLGNFYVEFWLRDDPDYIQNGIFYDKTSWQLGYVSGTDEFRAYMPAGVGNYDFRWILRGSADYVQDDWNHLVAEWQPGANAWRFWINGTLQVTTSAIVGVGLLGDAGQNFYFWGSGGAGDSPPWSRTWMRLADTTWPGGVFANYDELPQPTANTLLIFNGAHPWYGTLGVTSAFGGTPTIASGVLKWLNVADAPSYIATRQLNAIITANGGRYSFGVDYCFAGNSGAGTFGSNLIGNNGASVGLLGDRLYFGTNYNTAGSAPLIVLIRVTNQIVGTGWDNYLSAANFNYWNGAWVAIGAANVKWWWAPDDATESNGWYALVFTPPVADASRLLNGYPGFWIEWQVAVQAFNIVEYIGAVTDSGIGFNLADASLNFDFINGDIPALAAMLRAPIWEDKDISGVYDETFARSHLAIRTIERGEEFTPFINLITKTVEPTGMYSSQGDFNINGIYFFKTGGAPGSWWPVPAESLDAPCQFESQISVLASTTDAGYFIKFCDAYPASITGANFFTYRGEDRKSIAEQFAGRYRVFIRARGSVASDLTVYLYQSLPIPRLIGSTVLPTTMQVSELGVVDLPGLAGAVQKNTAFTLEFRFVNANAGPQTFYLWDLILWPVDEWSAYTQSIVESETAANYNTFNEYAHLIDPIGDRKFPRSASLAAPPFESDVLGDYVRTSESESSPFDAYPRGAIQFSGVESAILLNNRPFRLFSFNQRPYDPANGVFLAEGQAGTRSSFSVLRRYLSMRGVE